MTMYHYTIWNFILTDLSKHSAVEMFYIASALYLSQKQCCVIKHIRVESEN